MNWLIDKMGCFNTWYNGRQEPDRFLLFMALMVCSVFILHIGINLSSLTLTAIGLLNTSIVVMIAAMRAVKLGGVHRTMAKAMIITVFLIILMAALVV